MQPVDHSLTHSFEQLCIAVIENRFPSTPQLWQSLKPLEEMVKISSVGGSASTITIQYLSVASSMGHKITPKY